MEPKIPCTLNEDRECIHCGAIEGMDDGEGGTNCPAVPRAQCPEWTWEDRCALPAGHDGPHRCTAALVREAR
jgi:hypothetical protein